MVSKEAGVLIRMFVRTYFVGGCMNTRGMQNIGLSYAMDPGLRFLYRGDALQRARKHYLRIYNTHPCWTPLLVGLFFFLEQKIVKGILPAKTLPQMKSTIAYTLSAVGDSFFGGSLYVFWSLSTIVLVQARMNRTACVWAVFWILALEGFKLYTFSRGVSEGLSFFSRLRSWNMINWGARIKMLNALLIFILWVRFWPGPLTPVSWICGSIFLLGAAWCISFSYRAREVMVYMAGALLLIMPWIAGRLGDTLDFLYG